MACYLRKANNDDCALLFKWVNDSLVRQNSFSTQKISYDEHVKWFKNILKESNCIQYVYMDENCPVGQARIEVNDTTAEISYSIIPEKRSQGYGKALLLQICDEIWKEFPDVIRIIGKVKPENVVSQKAFEKAGYIEKYREYEISRRTIL